MHLKIILAPFMVLTLTITGCQTKGSTPQTEVNTTAADKDKKEVDNIQKVILTSIPSNLGIGQPKGSVSSIPLPCESTNLNLFSSKSETTEKTTFAHPTFFFQLNKPTPKPIFFALAVAETGKQEKYIFEKKIVGAHSGLFAVELPPDQPPLEFDKKYRWSVQIVCTKKQFLIDNNYQWSIIERIPVAPKLQKRLASARSDYERAKIYKQFGIRYDAALTGYKVRQTSPTAHPVSKFFEEFL